MQNKTLMWVLIAVVAAAGAWYYYTNSSNGTGVYSPNATTTAATTTSSQPTKAKTTTTTTKKPTSTTAKVVGIGSIDFLIDLKEPLVCSVKTTTGYARSGTLYVASGKARINFSASSMIDDGVHLFAWMTGAIKGLELLAASSASGSAIGSNGGVDPAADLSYACNPWAVDASVFTPPSSVSFLSTL